MASGATRRTVLVVDDSDDVRALIAVALRRRGFDVAEAPGAREALAWLRENDRPDLIILDMRMPDMDGRAFLREQERSETLSTIPVLVYSAEETSDIVARPGRAVVPKTAPLSAMLDEAGKLCS